MLLLGSLEIWGYYISTCRGMHTCFNLSNIFYFLLTRTPHFVWGTSSPTLSPSRVEGSSPWASRPLLKGWVGIWIWAIIVCFHSGSMLPCDQNHSLGFFPCPLWLEIHTYVEPTQSTRVCETEEYWRKVSLTEAALAVSSLQPSPATAPGVSASPGSFQNFHCMNYQLLTTKSYIS